MSGLKYTEKIEGSYRIHQYDVPLQNTTIVGTITDCFGNINVKQSYINTNDKTIEAIYLFPLKNTSSITDLQVTFGSGKKLVGDFQRKDLAKKTYTDAVSSSKKACILEKMNDSYQISIGNIEAGETVIVEYTYILTLDIVDNAFKFIFQTNIAPKYCPTTNITMKEINDPSNNLEYSNSVRHTFNFTLNCTSQNKINNITSFSHASSLITCKHSDNNWTVVTNVSPKEGDLNIFIHTELKPTLYHQTSANNEYVYSALLHQIDTIDTTIPNTEYIILLDRSGSMDTQDRIGLARNALCKFVEMLPIDTYFNIVSFGSKHQLMFPFSEKMTSENKKKCIETINTFKADMGGTEVFAPVDKVLKSPFQNEITERNIILISDGDVGNSSSIIRLIKSVASNTLALSTKDSGNIRFFTVGVGKDVSRSLIEGIAESGNGTSVFVNDNTINDCITKILDCSTKQYYKNITVDWGSDACIETNKINVLYPNKPFILFSKMPPSAFNKEAPLKITADNGKTNEKAEWTLQYSNNINMTSINQHYARRLLIDIEEGKSFYHTFGTDIDDIVIKATGLSIENKIVSNYVSLVLVSQEKTKTVNEMTTVKIPHYARGRQESEDCFDMDETFVKQSCTMLHNQCEILDSTSPMNGGRHMSFNPIGEESLILERSNDLGYLVNKSGKLSNHNQVDNIEHMVDTLSPRATDPKMFRTNSVGKGASIRSCSLEGTSKSMGSSFSLLDGCKNVFSNIKNYFGNLTQSDASILHDAYVANGLFNISERLLKTINAPKHDIIISIANKNKFDEKMVYHLLILKYLIETKDQIYCNDVKKYCADYFTKFSCMNNILYNIDKITVQEIIEFLQK